MSEELAEYNTGKSPVIYKEGSGLFADKFLLPSEDKKEFHQLREELSSDLSAKGTMELALVENIATIMYRINRLDEEEMISHLRVTSERVAREANLQAGAKLAGSFVRERMDKELAAAKAEAEGGAVGFWVLRDDCPETWKRLCIWLDETTGWLDCMTEEQYLQATSKAKAVSSTKEELAAVEAAKDAVTMPEGLENLADDIARLKQGGGETSPQDVATLGKSLDYMMAVEAAEASARAPFDAQRLREQAKLTANMTPAQKNLLKVIDYVYNQEDGGAKAVLAAVLEQFQGDYTPEDAQHDTLVGKHKDMAATSYSKINPRERIQRRRVALDKQLSHVTKELRLTQEHRWKIEKANTPPPDDDEIPEFLQGYQ